MTNEIQPIGDQILQDLNLDIRINGISNHELVRAARKAKGMSLRDLAKRVGCTHGFLSRYENGDKLPSASLHEKIWQALKIPLFYQERLPPQNASEVLLKRIEAENERMLRWKAESERIGTIARTRMLIAILLSALRSEGYEAEAHLSSREGSAEGEGCVVSIKVVGENGVRSTIDIREGG